MPTPLNPVPADLRASELTHRQALQVVARGLMGGLLGVVIDAVLSSKAGRSGPHLR